MSDLLIPLNPSTKLVNSAIDAGLDKIDAGELLSRIKDFADSHEGAAFDYDTFLSEDETETVYVGLYDTTTDLYQ
jgi:hypothetical protein